MRWPNFLGPSYISQSLISAGERTVNFYPEQIPRGNKTDLALFSCPGLATFATGGDSPGRGLFGEDGRLFAVLGTKLYEISSAGVFTARGTLALDGNPATFATSGDAGQELLITSGDLGYILDLQTNVLTQPVNNVTMAGQIDGFFVALDADSSTLRVSDSLDGQTWGGAQIIQRTAASDPWIAMLVINREIYLFGSKTGEVFYNAGSSPMPFDQRDEAFWEIGIAARWSLARFGQGMAWLGESHQGTGVVYAMRGYSPHRISNHAVEWAIAQYRASDGISNAIGWGYEALGHTFYVLEFPSSGRTWVYDETVDAWHERGRWESATDDYETYRARFHAPIFNRNLVADRASGRILSLSDTTYTDVGGSELRRLRRTPCLAAEHKRIFVDRIEVEADRGVGLVTGQGSNPQLMLRMSYDGGQSWGNIRSRTLGAIGAYDTQIKWDACGAGRDVVAELSITDPVPARLLNGYGLIRLGAH